jgi:chromosome segregation ATPase
MTLAMVLIGILLGLALSAIIALFGILSLDGAFGANLRDAVTEARLRIAGRRGAGAASATAAETRILALQGEIRVMQRVLERSRGERQADSERIAALTEENAGLCSTLERCQHEAAAAEGELQSVRAERDRLRNDLMMCNTELETARRRARDLETEISVLAAGGDAPDEIERLRQERDELAARLARLEAPADHREELGFVL